MSRVLALIFLAGFLFFISHGTALEKQPKKEVKKEVKSTGTLTVFFPAQENEPQKVLVSLYSAGELIRSRELLPELIISDMLFDARYKKTNNNNRHSVTWSGLPSGVYDICFEAKGFALGVKRVRVCPEDEDKLRISVEIDKTEYDFGNMQFRDFPEFDPPRETLPRVRPVKP